MRSALAAVLVLACALSAVAQEVQVPPDVEAVLAECHEAVVMNDIEAAKSYLTPSALLQAHFTGMGKQGDVLRLNETYLLDSLEREYLECMVREDRVGVIYNLTIKGTEKQTGEEKTVVWQRAEVLERKGDKWLIATTVRLDPERLAKALKDGKVVDEDYGIEAPIPEGWDPMMVYGIASAVITIGAPDLTTAVLLIAQDLPINLSAKAVADAEVKGRDALGIGVQTRKISEGETTLAGKPAYESTTAMTFEGETTVSRRVYCVETVGGRSILYAFIAAGEEEAALKAYEKEIKLIENGLKLTGAKEVELPPELGKVADGKYINPTYELTFDIPKGWDASIARSRQLFQVTLSKPGSKSTLLATAVSIQQWVDPKLVAHGDLSVYKKQAPDLKVLNEGPITKQDVQGYQILSELTLGDDGLRRRWQVFFMRGTTIYVLLGEAVPATDYDNVLEDWGVVMDSLTFGPIEQDQ